MHRFLSLAAFLSLVVVVAACGRDNEAIVCDGLNPPQCPDQGGLGCEDPSCQTTYECNAGGVWTYVQTCPSYVPPPDAGPDAAEGGLGDGGAADTKFPFPIPAGAYGGVGCIDPIPPDCWLGTVVGCYGSNDPCCGCDTLFLCQDDEYVTWGECQADGGIVNSGE